MVLASFLGAVPRSPTAVAEWRPSREKTSVGKTSAQRWCGQKFVQLQYKSKCQEGCESG